MTIRPSASNDHIQSPFEVLPPELTKNIAKRIGSVMAESTNIPLGKLQQEAMVAKAKGDAARCLINLGVVNKEFRAIAKQVLQESPDVEMTATSMAIRDIREDSQFREKIARLIQRSKHIAVPFQHLSPAGRKTVLRELARPELTQHLEVVELDLSGVKLDSDPAPSPNQQESSTGVSRSPWKLAWLLGKMFKNHHYADEPDKSVFEHLLTAIQAMSQHEGQFPHIQLDLNRAALHDQGAEEVARILQKSKITSLRLLGNDIGESGGEALAQAVANSALTELDLSFNYDMGQAAVLALANALPASKLVSLKLNSAEIRDESAIAIFKALPATPLTHLSLEANRIGDAAAIAIGEVLADSRLIHLDLSVNGIKDDGAIAIARALPQSGLVNLNFRANDIRDAGALAIFNELPQSCLKHLNLGWNKIGAYRTTAAAIANAIPGSKLEYLNISENSFLYVSEIKEIAHAGDQGENPIIIE